MPSVALQHQILRTLREPEAIERVLALSEDPAPAHRSALAERVCAQFGFLDARGRPQRSTCLKALRALERAGHIVLPAPRTRPGPAHPRRLPAPVPAPHKVPARAEQVRALELVLVEDEQHRRVWNELMAGEHPRGAGPLVGCQLRYLVGSAHGWLGALGLAAAALQLAERERWVGWDVECRRAHLHRVVGLNRFLIRPMVRCHNLASRVLGQALRALPEDFERRFGYRPWLVESFVDSPAHTGVGLRAATWGRGGRAGARGARAGSSARCRCPTRTSRAARRFSRYMPARFRWRRT